MKILSVVGARPQFIKLAPVAKAISRADHHHVIVHTGQHYDIQLSDVFFEDLQIPIPTVNLGVGSGTHGVQTGAMMSALDGVFEQYRPDCVLVYGDTNSTVAAALCAVKMRLPLVHLEAGLRSFNRDMPEEHNRVLTDHAADLCLAPTAVAIGNLRSEGLSARSRQVGDVMIDVLFQTRDAASQRPPILPEGVADSDYYVATVHRAENTDSRERLHAIADGLASLDRPVILLAHPRLVAASERHGVLLHRGSCRVIPPESYSEIVRLVLRSAGVVTDSGGLQKEAFMLRRPCTTLRSETEWVETVDLGWNTLVNPASMALLPGIVANRRPAPVDDEPYGDGTASVRTIQEIEFLLDGGS